MGDEALAHHAALPGQDLEHPLGQAGFERQLTDAQGAERCQLGRLEHHGVPGRQGRRQAPAGDGHGEVPRDDDPHHPEGFVEGEVDPTGHGDLATAVALGRGGVVLEHVADVARLPAGVADHVTGIGHLERGQLLAAAVDLGGETAQQAGPIAGGHLPPALVRRGRPADGHVDLGLTQRADLGDHVPGRRIAQDRHRWLTDPHRLICTG